MLFLYLTTLLTGGHIEENLPNLKTSNLGLLILILKKHRPLALGMIALATLGDFDRHYCGTPHFTVLPLR